MTRDACATMCDMRRLNVRELHRHTGAVVDQVTQGEVVIILKRGTPVVEMRPAAKIGAGFPPEHWEWLKKFPQFNNDSGRFISEDRDRG
jgi:prevent-host-death family protein